ERHGARKKLWPESAFEYGERPLPLKVTLIESQQMSRVGRDLSGQRSSHRIFELIQGLAHQVQGQRARLRAFSRQKAKKSIDALGLDLLGPESAQPETRHIRIEIRRIGIGDISHQDTGSNGLIAAAVTNRKERFSREVRIVKQMPSEGIFAASSQHA